MRRARSPYLATCGLLAGLLLPWQAAAASGRFSINPTLVAFSQEATSALVSVTRK